MKSKIESPDPMRPELPDRSELPTLEPIDALIGSCAANLLPTVICWTGAFFLPSGPSTDFSFDGLPGFRFSGVPASWLFGLTTA